jgi:hypothetical protein
MTVVGDEGTVRSDAAIEFRDECGRWRLKFRKLFNDFGGDDKVVVIVLMLLTRPGDCGVRGVVGTVHMLFVRVLLPLEDPPEELLVLELNLRILLKALMLDIGGLDGITSGCCCASGDSGAA